MIVLTEQIEIPASYEKLKAWTANFEEEFVKWSPYHIECNLYNGNYHAGSKVRFREIVMGLDYDVTGTITECEQDENHFRIVFRSDKKTAFITFEQKRHNNRSCGKDNGASTARSCCDNRHGRL